MNDFRQHLGNAIRKAEISALIAQLEQWGEQYSVSSNKTKTPLMIAAEAGIIEAVRLLLDHGVDVDGKNDCGETALTLAADGGHTEIAALLLDRGADVNVFDYHSDTPLANAAGNEHEDTLRLLLKHGANPNVVNVNGDLTPLTIAIAHDRYNIVAILLEGGADPNKPDRDGDTPFMMVLHDESMTQMMLAHGADVNWRNNKGISVLKWAYMNCDHKAIPLLEAAGAIL